MDEKKDDELVALEKSKRSRRGEAMFLTGITGMSVVFGFGYAVAMAKRNDPNGFIEGVMGKPGAHETGGSLALRALGRATLITVPSFCLFCFGIWKLMGVHSAEEFRYKVGSALPKLPKNDPDGRRDFKTLKDLADFLVSEDEKKSTAAKS